MGASKHFLHTPEKVYLDCGQSWLKSLLLSDYTRFCCRKRRTLQWRSLMLQDPPPTLLDKSSAIPNTHSVRAQGVKGGSFSCAALKAHCIYNRKVTHTPQWAASLCSVLPGFMPWRQRCWGNDLVRTHCCGPQLPHLHREAHRLFPNSLTAQLLRSIFDHIMLTESQASQAWQLLPSSWQFLFHSTLAKCNLLMLSQPSSMLVKTNRVHHHAVPHYCVSTTAISPGRYFLLQVN